MSHPHQRPKVAEIMARLRSGDGRIPEIARELGVSYWTVYEVARRSGLPYIGRHLTAKEKQQIRVLVESDGITGREAAKQIGRAKTTVCRYIAARRQKIVDSVGGSVRPKPTKTPKRCPVHGLVMLWPCVACAATANSRRGQNRDRG